VLPAIAAAAAAAAAITAAATTATAAATTATAAAAATAATTTTATAAIAATTATTATTTAAAATTTLTFLRFIHAQGSAVEHRAVHLGDRLLGLGIAAHGNESETARLARFAIGRDVYVAHLAKGGESGANGVRSCVERQIANVETVTHVLRSIQSRLEENENPAVQSAAVGSGRGRGEVPRPRVVATSRDT
jgi:hypothetical protein